MILSIHAGSPVFELRSVLTIIHYPVGVFVCELRGMFTISHAGDHMSELRGVIIIYASVRVSELRRLLTFIYAGTPMSDLRHVIIFHAGAPLSELRCVLTCIHGVIRVSELRVYSPLSIPVSWCFS